MKKIFGLALVIGLAAGYAAAEVTVTAGVALDEGVWDDNIYLSAFGNVSSIITSVKPSLAIISRKPMQLLSLAASGNLIFYTEDPDKNNDQQATLALLAERKFRGGLSLNLRNRFMMTSDPSSSELTERLGRIQNDLAGIVGYAVSPKTSIELRGGHVLHEYADAIADRYNRTETSAGLKAYYRFLPRTSALIRYRMGLINYDSVSRDSVNNSVSLGIKGNLTGKITALVTGGYQMRNYDDASISDFNTPIAELDLTHRLSRRTSINLTGDYKLVESFYGANPHYTETGGSLAVDRKLGNGITVRVSGGYKLNSYPEKTSTGSELKERADNILVAAVGLSYPVQRWGLATLTYEYKDRDSTHGVFDYTRNRLSLLLSSRFNFNPSALGKPLAAAPVKSVTVKPEVQITSPYANEQVKGDSVTLSWKTTRGSAAVARTEVSLDNGPLRRASSAEAHTFTGLQPGRHSLRVNVTDMENNTASASVAFIVEKPVVVEEPVIEEPVIVEEPVIEEPVKKEPVITEKTTPPSPMVHAVERAEKKDVRIYTVQPWSSHRDSLSNISKRVYGVHGKWHLIYRANKDTIRDPNLIRAGQKLIIPSID